MLPSYLKQHDCLHGHRNGFACFPATENGYGVRLEGEHLPSGIREWDQTIPMVRPHVAHYARGEGVLKDFKNDFVFVGAGESKQFLANGMPDSCGAFLFQDYESSANFFLMSTLNSFQPVRKAAACAATSKKAAPAYGSHISGLTKKASFRRRGSAHAAFPASSGHLRRWIWRLRAGGMPPRAQAHRAVGRGLPGASRGRNPWQSKNYRPVEPLRARGPRGRKRSAAGCAHSRGAVFEVGLGSREIADDFAFRVDPVAVGVNHAKLRVLLQLPHSSTDGAG